MLDGLLLGDGNLWAARTRPGCNAMYRQSSVSPDWLADLAERWRTGGYPSRVSFARDYVCKDGRVSRIWWLQTGASFELTAQRGRWYPEGRKRCPMDFVMTRDVVLQWFLGDGTMRRGSGRQRPFAAFCAEWYTRREVDWLISGLEAALLPGAFRTAVRRDGWNIEATTAGTAVLFDYIGVCPYPSLARKFDCARAHDEVHERARAKGVDSSQREEGSKGG